MNQENNQGFFETIVKSVLGIFKKAEEITERQIAFWANCIRWIFVAFAIILTLLLIDELNSEMDLWWAFITLGIGALIGFISKKSKGTGIFLTIVTGIAFILLILSTFLPGVKSLIQSYKSDKDNRTFQDYIPGTKTEQEIITHYKSQEESILKEVKKLNSEGREEEAQQIWSQFLEKGEKLKWTLDSTKRAINRNYISDKGFNVAPVKDVSVVKKPTISGTLIMLKKGERRSLISFSDNSMVYFESSGAFSIVERTTLNYNKKNEEKIKKSSGITSHYYTWGGSAIVIAEEDIAIKAWLE